MTQQVELTDLNDPSVTYPSLDAAIASAMFQHGTDKPALGPTLFRVTGAIHQKYESARQKLQNPADINKQTDLESAMMLAQTNPSNIAKLGATWNLSAWEAARDSIFKSYLSQRYATDARFRAMLQAIKSQDGIILFVRGVVAGYLNTVIATNGTIKGGENKLGKWLSELA
jgi:predicted NAD-dependent protein-ADP-ribosyltransferase YbiA (DUF1768 family)